MNRRSGPSRRPATGRPHALYLAIGFPPAATSGAPRMRETANQLAAHGWDVTVVTIRRDAWERDCGLDDSLSAGVHPAVRVVELPLQRADLETDVRRYSRDRSLDPKAWAAGEANRHLGVFPEPWYGAWRPVLEQALLDLHRRDPADLLVTTCAPYVSLAATRRLWAEHRVPYVVDFRDGWSLDVVGGGAAFPRGSVAGRWEAEVLASATAVWCVNEPIAGFYRDRYPALADRIMVVRNGWEPAAVPTSDPASAPGAGLRFGYLGTLTVPPASLATVLDAWRTARAADPALAGATFEVLGRLGAPSSRAAGACAELLAAAHGDGVRWGGPVAAADVADRYASWDVLVLLLPGGRFMTSGTVYEALAGGRPVLSAHEVEHDATTVLAGRPMWIPPVGFDGASLAGSFRTAARMAGSSTAADRSAARRAGARHTRAAQLEPAVRRITSIVRGMRSAAREPA